MAELTGYERDGDEGWYWWRTDGEAKLPPLDAKGRKARPDALAMLRDWRLYERRLTLVPSTVDNVLEILPPPRVFDVDEV